MKFKVGDCVHLAVFWQEIIHCVDNGVIIEANHVENFYRVKFENNKESCFREYQLVLNQSIMRDNKLNELLNEV